MPGCSLLLEHAELDQIRRSLHVDVYGVRRVLAGAMRGTTGNAARPEWFYARLLPAELNRF